jgi:hypothetical protein
LDFVPFITFVTFHASVDVVIMKVLMQVRAIPLQNGQKLEHQGLRVQLIGVIELLKAGVKNHEFLSLCVPPRLFSIF